MASDQTSFTQCFRIADREVGGAAPTLFIAEAGVAHFGDMGLARRLVDLAADAGADVFKTQFFDVDALYAKRAAEWRERLRPRNMTLAQAQDLKSYCEKLGLLFMSTPHDETRIGWLAELDVPAIKVGSGERNNPAFLSKLAGLGRPMIVSTGMSDLADVEEAVSACAAGGCYDVALLHCVTSYPTPPEQVNLSAMDAMRQIFQGPIGYSDHTADNLAIRAAVARGAKVVEKHITILRDVPNAQDWKVSAGEEDLADLIADVRRIEQMIGEGRKVVAKSEIDAHWALKSLVAARDLPAGHRLSPSDLVAKRPGDGIAPNRIEDLLGRALKRDVGADDPILPEHLTS